MYTLVPLGLVSVVAKLYGARVPLESDLFVFVAHKDRRSHAAWFDLDAGFTRLSVGNSGPASLVLHLNGSLNKSARHEVEWSSH